MLGVPPPTTLLGALTMASLNSEPEVSILGGKLCSSSARIVDDVPWAALALIDERFVTPLGLIEVRDLSRAMIAPYLRRAHVYKGSPQLFGVQPHGRIYAPSMRVHVLFITKKEGLAEWVFAIRRVGSKESIASAIDLRVRETVIEDPSDNVKTRYYFPARLCEKISGKYIRDSLSVPKKENYSLGAVYDLSKIWEEFIIPLEEVNVQPTQEAAILRDPDGEPVLVPREVLKTDQR
ncbi:MAG: type I-A CRISPR-associated protein Cas5a [Sulfolobales archaeon]